jgi:hypothetical protein
LPFAAGALAAARTAARNGEPLDALLPVERFAAIQAELWAGDRAAAEVLESYGMDEIGWRLCECRQAEVLTDDARAGKAARARELADALRNAVARRGGAAHRG